MEMMCLMTKPYGHLPSAAGVCVCMQCPVHMVSTFWCAALTVSVCCRYPNEYMAPGSAFRYCRDVHRTGTRGALAARMRSATSRRPTLPHARTRAAS